MSTRDPKASAQDLLPERFSAPTPMVPDEATWRTMTPEQREAKVWEIIDGMPFEETMSEGTPHSSAKASAVERLKRFFRHRNRGVFVAPELAVLYPGERSFVPDVLAVCDVELKDRNAWIVMDEGRGPDFILEIRNKGKRAKDYKRNVATFARLGIPEYFVYDCIRRDLAGYRLEPEGGRTYGPIIPQGGRYTCRALELDLAVADGQLRFFHAGAELPDADMEVTWLTRMVAEREARLEEESRRAAVEAERAARAVEPLRAAILAVLSARGLEPDAEVRARLSAISDPDQLAGLVTRAATATHPSDLFEPRR